MARDEWPLLGLAIEHALAGHAEHVVVLDHASCDGTAAGLDALSSSNPGRVTVVRLDDPAYLQEAATALMVSLGPRIAWDWVYVFDADEFILTPNGASLPDVLDGIDPAADAVRYAIDNWVTPSHFDDLDVSGYAEIRYRAVPNIFAETGMETVVEIERGNVNFFDVPFPSKVIVRAASAAWIAAGAHGLRHQTVVESVMPADRLRAAHLPLLSRRRLALKARQGQALIDAGLPPGHGWQNQMVRRLEVAGELEDFWAWHSLPLPEGPPHRTGPSLVLDDAIGPVVANAISRTDRWRQRTEQSGWRDTPAVAAFRSIAAVQAVANRLSVDLAEVRRAHGLLVEEQYELVAQRDALVAQRDALVAQRDALVAQRDALVAHRDVLTEQLGALTSSRSWRITRPLRALKRKPAARSTPMPGE